MESIIHAFHASESNCEFLRTIALPLVAQYPDAKRDMAGRKITFNVKTVNGKSCGFSVSMDEDKLLRFASLVDGEEIAHKYAVLSNIEECARCSLDKAVLAANIILNKLTEIELELKKLHPGWRYETKENVLNIIAGNYRCQDYGFRVTSKEKLHVCVVLNGVPFKMDNRVNHLGSLFGEHRYDTVDFVLRFILNGVNIDDSAAKERARRLQITGWSPLIYRLITEKNDSIMIDGGVRLCIGSDTHIDISIDGDLYCVKGVSHKHNFIAYTPEVNTTCAEIAYMKSLMSVNVN